MKHLTKRIASILLVLVLLMGLFAVPMGSFAETATDESSQESALKWDDDGVLKILAIGNSFSVDTLEYTVSIAKSLGIKKLVIGNLYVAGCSLDTHLTNAKNDTASYTYYLNTNGAWTENTNYKMSTAIKSENWDFVSLQQASGYSGLPDSYSALSELVTYVRNTANNDVTFIWNMTWAYSQSSNHSSFPNYNNNQLTMYNAIVSTTQEKIVGNQDFATIIPAGTAIQNARTSYIGDTLNRDGYHLSYGLGRYIAGLTFVKQLTGLSIDNVEFLPNNVAAEQKEVAIEAANNAVENPFEVTESEVKTAHSYGSYSVTQAATCTEEGEKTKVCSDCGKSLSVAVNPVGHSYGSWIVDKEPTEAEAGSKHRDCSACGNRLTVAIPATLSDPDSAWDFGVDCSEDFEKNITKFAATAKANKDASALMSYNASNTAYEMKYPSGYYSSVGVLVNNKGFESFELLSGYKFSCKGTGNNLITPGVIYAKDENGIYLFSITLTRTASGTYARYHVYYLGCSFGDDGAVTMAGANTTGTGTPVSNKDINIAKIVVTENASGAVVTNEDVGVSFQKLANDAENGIIRMPEEAMDIGALRNRYDVQAAADGTQMITTTLIYTDDTYTYEYTLQECVATAQNVKIGGVATAYSASSYYGCLEHTSYETACGAAGYSAANSASIATQIYSVKIYGGTSGSSCEHSYDSVVTAPTCTAAGFTTYTCSLCGNKKTGNKVAALGHTEVIDAAVEATCVETGLTQGAHCSVCGEITTAQEITPVINHNFAEPEITKTPTCTEAGEKAGICTSCGGDVTEVIDALGHDLKTVTAPSTCTEAGSTTTTCSRCDYEDIAHLPLADHSYGDWIIDKEATEEEEGSMHKTCVVCGDTVTETIGVISAVPNFDWNFKSEEAVNDALANSVHISGNGVYETANSLSKNTVTYNAATNALELGYASNYNTPINGLLVKTPEGGKLHSYSAEVGIAERNNVSAVYNGSVIYGIDDTNLYFLNFTYFSGFRMYYAYRNVANKVADVWADDYWALAKGSATQKYVDVKFYTIKKNGEVVADYESGLDTHVLESYADFQTYIATDLPASLSADSFKTVTTKYDVTVDGGVSTIVATMVFRSDENIYEVQFAPVTASSAGLTYLNTGYSQKTIELATSNYEPAAGVVMYGKPSSGNPSVQVYSLNVNYGGETGGEGGDDTHTHDYTAVVTAPTCETEGYTTYTCECGDSYVDNKVAALGHDTTTETVEATCEAAGSKTTTCSRCDYKTVEEIAALGHDTTTVTVDATCEAAGSKTTACSRCDYKTVEEIAALGHDTTTETVEATCEAAGSKTTACSRCDYKDVVTIPAKGHTESGWIVDKEATETEEGSKHTECTVCGATIKTEVIPATGSGEDVVYGDANGDGSVNVADAVLIAKHTAGTADIDEALMEALDVDGDGFVNIIDAVLISRFAAGLITELPVNK